VLESLVAWKRESLYQAESDFVFASIRLKGKKLMGPDNLLKRYIRPALERAGIVGKVIGWYNFRHSVGDEPVSDGRRREGGAGTIAPCELRTTLDYLHPSGLAVEARGQCEGGRDDVAGCFENASAPSAQLEAVG